jgi:hypothetical protein
MRLTKSRDGLIDMGDAALWLVQYPVRQYDDSDSTGRLTAMLTGFSILGNELTERYGPLPMIECEGGVTTGARPNSPDYRRDPDSAAKQWVSIDLLRTAAVKEGNVPLVKVIDEATTERLKVLGSAPVAAAATSSTVATARDVRRTRRSPVEADGTDWKEVARGFANEVWHQRPAGTNLSKADIADKVAATLRERGVYGPRGPVQGAYVLRHVLRGWQKPDGPRDAGKTGKSGKR